jgi:hypothetical protein
MSTFVKEFGLGACANGSGYGSTIFAVKFGYDDKILEGENPAAENAKLILDDLTQKVKDNGWEQQWKILLLGKIHGLGIYFIGDDIVEETNRLVFSNLFILLSRVSVEAQRMFAIPKISEPYVVWVGTPKIYSSLDDFYNNFNHIFVECPLSDYSQVAFMEQRNHNFARFNFTINTKEDLALLDKLYREPKLIETAPQKIQITASKEVWDDALAYAMKYAYHIYPKIDTTLNGFVGNLT